MGRSRIIRLDSLENTRSFGAHVARFLSGGAILALYGELGTGKTSFVQGLALGLGIQDAVNSPTFGYLNLYEGSVPLYHFDLYRMVGVSDFLAMGFEEYFSDRGIAAIEWAERIASMLPPSVIHFTFSHQKKGRSVTFSSALDANLVELLATWD